MEFELYHLIVYVPETHADAMRKALSIAGAGKIGKYDSCSFSMKGAGRFRPLKGAKPAIGSEDTLEEVTEERIEVVVKRDQLKLVLHEIKRVHPYEEAAIHVLPMMDYHDFL